MLDFFRTHQQINANRAQANKLERDYTYQNNRLNCLLDKIKPVIQGYNPMSLTVMSHEPALFYYLYQDINSMFDIIKGRKAENTMDIEKLTALLRKTCDALEGKLSFKDFSEQTAQERGVYWEIAGGCLVFAMLALLLTTCAFVYTVTLTPPVLLASLVLVALMDITGLYFSNSKTGFAESVSKVDRRMNNNSADEKIKIKTLFTTEEPMVNHERINQASTYQPLQFGV